MRRPGTEPPAAQASLKGKPAARDWLLPSELKSHARAAHTRLRAPESVSGETISLPRTLPCTFLADVF